ncbi:ribonuclease D [Pistricoccus aurantiacus]|uniref:Ribonuclease D n=1 Tax=Pistricoccus aurantiacus TaxID=1883414 RepID=A0A5B8SU57_9GAMM|nr:ribonuclease D [Pistricoccus aurantiacus]QEA39527.1 ribonuclease D [Pistricoccus aurantiacus]
MSLDLDIRWIDTPQALDAACRALSQADTLAMDTEFFRESTFYPVPALIQLYGGGPVYLIDPQAVKATQALRELLASGPLKLLHASSEDLEVMRIWADVAIAPVMDTQLAQALLGEDPAMSYQRLVERWTGEVLPKDETRSDWLERPLSDSQQRYAAWDVVYLLDAWRAQRKALEGSGRLTWLEEDCHTLGIQEEGNAANGQWYLRQRQLWRLSPRQIEAYQRLTQWRETEVRRRNLPRGWLINDKLLYEIAERMPKNKTLLADIQGLKPALIKREGDTLLALVEQARQQAQEELPAPLPSPMTPAFKKRLKALKQVVAAEAETLGLAPEVLMRRRDLEALVGASLLDAPLPLPRGWRGERLAQPLANALKEVATT